MSPISTVLTRVAFPPLYYLLLNVWVAVFGDAWWTLRAFSAVAGGLAVFAFGRLVLALFDRRGLMLVAATAFALMPQAIAFSRHVRMYSLWMLCLLVAAWGAVAAARAARPAARDLCRYWLGVAAAAATHHYTMFYVAAVVLGTYLLTGKAALRKDPADWRRLALLHGPLVVLAVLMVGAAAFLAGLGIAGLIEKIQRDLYTVAPFQPLEDLARLVFLRAWAYGQGFPARETLLAVSVLGTVALALAARSGRRQVAFLLLVGVVCPVVVLALPTRSYARLLSPAVPHLVALIAFGAWLLWQRPWARLLLVPFAGAWFWLVTPAIQGVYRFESEPWKTICATVDTAEPATGIMLNEPYMRGPFEVCYDGPHPLLTFPRHRQPVDPERLRAFVRDKDVVWVIYARATRSDRQRQGLRLVVAEGFRLVNSRRYGSVIQLHRLVRVPTAE